MTLEVEAKGSEIGSGWE